MGQSQLIISHSPHIKGKDSIESIMYGVVIAMLPALMASAWFYGIGALKVVIFSVIFSVIFEFLIQKYLLKIEPTVKDGSAIVTGILLGFNLPSSLPIWMIGVGALVAIGIAKLSFGGLGKNPFNPALVGRVFLLVSFPVEMTSWPRPLDTRTMLSIPDALTGATPLGLIKEGVAKGEPIAEIMKNAPSHLDALFGAIGGSVGEVSALALIVGGLYLLYKKIITWHIPISFLGTIAIFSGVFWLIQPEKYVDPLYHLLTGGILLGAFFMATDMVTSPMSKLGMLFFGAGAGLITILIRLFGAYPEGVSFAILIMNAIVPLINIAFKPKRFGEVKNG